MQHSSTTGSQDSSSNIFIMEPGIPGAAIPLWTGGPTDSVMLIMGITSHDLRARKHHLPYWITQCYLPPDTCQRVAT